MPYKDPEKKKAASRAYWEKNKEKHRALVRENSRKRLAAMTDEDRRKMWRDYAAAERANPEANERKKAAMRKWYQNAKERRKSDEPLKQKLRDATERWRQRNWEKVKTYHRERRARDPIYRMIFCLRTQCCQYLQGVKSKRTMELIGCTVQELRDHIEAQFTEGMVWGNQECSFRGRTFARSSEIASKDACPLRGLRIISLLKQQVRVFMVISRPALLLRAPGVLSPPGVFA